MRAMAIIACGLAGGIIGALLITVIPYSPEMESTAQIGGFIAGCITGGWVGFLAVRPG